MVRVYASNGDDWERSLFHTLLDAFFARSPELVSRVRTHSDPECDDGSEDDGGQEVDGELVIACGNTTKVLEATERSFDPPAIAVASLIVPDRTSARTSAWNDRYCSR
jgi:hypothetical protein